MTIAMGFQCLDGVLLCADTEISRGWSGKSQESKIHILSKGSKGRGCACVYAGDVDFMKKVLPSLEATVRDQTDKLVERLEREWRTIHKKSLTRKRQGEEYPFIQMMFAVGTGRGPRLYSANRDIFRPERKYDIIGVGEEVARSFVEPFYPKSPNLPLFEDVAILAAGGLYQAKEYVRGCGKESLYLWFDEISDQTNEFDHGFFEVSERATLDRDFVFLQKRLAPLVIASSQIGGIVFRDALKEFEKRMKKYHLLRGRELKRAWEEAERDLERNYLKSH
jgi:20S proteasome alpha/beta subunit